MVTPVAPPDARMLIAQELSDDGLITGAVNPIGDFSGVSKAYYYIQPPAGEIYCITRMLIQVEDAAIVAEEYGGLGAALTNGLWFRILTSADVVVQTLHNAAIKSNGLFAHLCYDIASADWGNPAASDFFTARWTFSKFGMPGIILQDQMKFGVYLQDSFAGLIQNRFMVQGYNITRDIHGNLIR